MDSSDLKHFFDEDGRVTLWPAKPKKQMLVLQFLAGKLEWERQYTEQEINELLTQYHTFGDAALLRRELYMKHFLDRKADGSAYWKTGQLLPKEWETARLIIREALKKEIPELQKIYDECAYIGEMTGYNDERENPMLSEYNHETLPPDGKPELHRLQSILEKKKKQLVGYLISYHGFPDPQTFWIAVLAIRPSCQRQKYGQEVMNELSENVKKLSTFHRMGISVGVGNDPAINFWSACGFTKVIKVENHGTHSEQWIVKDDLEKTP